MKEDVGYEEFLAAVYEAETEGTEGKVLNVKEKAIMVEKVVEKERTYQSPRSKTTDRVISYNYEKHYDGKCKIIEGEGISSSQERNVSKLSSEGISRITHERKRGS